MLKRNLWKYWTYLAILCWFQSPQRFDILKDQSLSHRKCSIGVAEQKFNSILIVSSLPVRKWTQSQFHLHQLLHPDQQRELTNYV